MQVQETGEGDDIEHTWSPCQQDALLVHVCEIDPTLLENGDFYFCVVPIPDKSGSVELVLKFVADDSVHDQPVPSEGFNCLLTMDWLNSANVKNDFDLRSALKNCLVAVEEGIERMTWEEVEIHHIGQRSRSNNVGLSYHTGSSGSTVPQEVGQGSRSTTPQGSPSCLSKRTKGCLQTKGGAQSKQKHVQFGQVVMPNHVGHTMEGLPKDDLKMTLNSGSASADLKNNGAPQSLVEQAEIHQEYLKQRSDSCESLIIDEDSADTDTGKTYFI